MRLKQFRLSEVLLPRDWKKFCSMIRLMLTQWIQMQLLPLLMQPSVRIHRSLSGLNPTKANLLSRCVIILIILIQTFTFSFMLLTELCLQMTMFVSALQEIMSGMQISFRTVHISQISHRLILLLQ